ncbi:hypothetical protein HUU40_21760 [candidate division KSB1 bacterium]|nr:hypothetical protein [candidate division KSB1 bacterium]
MLYPQTRQSKISKLLSKADIQIPTPVGRLNIQKSDSNEDVIPILEKTVSFLRRNDLIGSLDEPKEYIHGIVELRTAIPVYDELSSLIVDVALWGNRNIPFVLVGSRKHLIGEDIKTKDVGGNFSQLRHIISLLEMMQRNNVFHSNLKSLPTKIKGSKYGDRGLLIDRATVYDHCRFLCACISGPSRKYEFVARVLLMDGPEVRRKSIIATPLYVALSG